MKQSDSTTSLTELTGRDECFICLSVEHEQGEPLVDSKLLRTCGCKFTVHPTCWNQWMTDKTDYDCPICRKQSVLRVNIPPNPVLLIPIPEEGSRRFIGYRWKCFLLLLIIGFGAGFLVALLYTP